MVGNYYAYLSLKDNTRPAFLMRQSPSYLEKMPSTILQFLNRPNPKVYRYAAPGSLTSSGDWIGIDCVQTWEDFTYDLLCAWFKTERKKTLPSWDPSDLIKKAHFNETVNGESVAAFLRAMVEPPAKNSYLDRDEYVDRLQ
jgi:hypothetical protein